jgi:hypothetical protein
MNAAQLESVVAGMARHFRLEAYREISHSWRIAIASPPASGRLYGWSGLGKTGSIRGWTESVKPSTPSSLGSERDQRTSLLIEQQFKRALNLRQATICKMADPRFARGEHGEVYVSMAYLREVLRTKPHNAALVAHLKATFASVEPSPAPQMPVAQRPAAIIEIDTDPFSGFVVTARVRRANHETWATYRPWACTRQRKAKFTDEAYLAHRRHLATSIGDGARVLSVLRERRRSREGS